MVKEIVLSNGMIAKVDDEDYPKLKEFAWHCLKTENLVYARRRAVFGKRNNEQFLMHREVMGFPNQTVDHRDSDGLNNQKSNLRVATRSQKFVGTRVERSGWPELGKTANRPILGFFPAKSKQLKPTTKRPRNCSESSLAQILIEFCYLRDARGNSIPSPWLFHFSGPE